MLDADTSFVLLDVTCSPRGLVVHMHFLQPKSIQYCRRRNLSNLKGAWVHSVARSHCGTHLGSVTSMLDHLESEPLESRHAKNQLSIFFMIIHGILVMQVFDYLVPVSTRTRSQHSLKFHQIPACSDYLNV